MTSYTYNDVYHTQLTKEYKRDGSTTVKEETVLSADSKVPVQSLTYENGNLVAKETYLYDDNNSANPSTVRSCKTGIEYTEQNITYLNKSLPLTKTVAGVTTNYTYDELGRAVSTTDGNVIAEYGTKGTKKYIRGAGGEIVKTKDSASNSRYFSYNAHGDTTNIIEKKAESTSFAVTAAYEYDAFGGLVSGTGGEADSNAFRYNGQYTDEETGLIYLRNRYYDPSIGRFTQEDTYWNPGNMIYGDQQFEDGEVKIPDYLAIVQSANLYVYCANDPVNGSDPSGNYYVIDDIERAIWKLGAKYYLDEYKGWYLTATLLERAADGPGNSFVSNGGDYATEAVRNHPGFRSAVNDLIWATAGSYGSLYVDSWGSYEFKLSDGDLGAALHKTSFHVNGYKDESGRWQVYVSVYDVF